MPLVNSKADGNVPPLPGRARYSVVGARTATWVFHKGVLDGLPPAKTAGSTDTQTVDPDVVRGGYAVWSGLLHGGLFTQLAHAGVPIVVTEVSNTGCTAGTVDSTGAVLRATLPAVPFTLAPGECVKATGGVSFGLLVKTDESTIL